MSKLTPDKIDKLTHIFTTKTFDKGVNDERTIYVFTDKVMNNNKITDKFYDLGMEIDDYYYEWIHSCLLTYSENLIHI